MVPDVDFSASAVIPITLY